MFNNSRITAKSLTKGHPVRTLFQPKLKQLRSFTRGNQLTSRIHSNGARTTTIPRPLGL